METSGPIQAQVGGFLGFLQLKNNGRNPGELPNTMQSVIDVRQWFWQTYAEVIVGTDAAIAAAGLVDKLTVPQGEFWAVHDVTLTATVAAASTSLFQPYYRNGLGAANSFPFPLSVPTRWAEATDGTSVLVPMTPRETLLLQPGGVLGVRALFLSAATTAGNLVARVTRLRA